MKTVEELEKELAATKAAAHEKITTLQGYLDNLDKAGTDQAIEFRRQLNEKDKRFAELQTAYEAYLEYLRDAEDAVAGFLHVHNWKYSQELLDKGEPLRQKIRNLTK